MAVNVDANQALSHPEYSLIQPLADAIERICRALDPADQPAAARRILAEFVAWPEIRATLAAIPIEGQRAHGLWFDADGRFSILLYQWRPAGVSPIHDHWCWGAVAGIAGAEVETLYVPAGPGLARPVGVRCLEPGGTVAFTTGSAGLHRVACRGDAPARSLHVYGGDLSRRGLSSIDRTYTEAVAEAPAERGSPT